MTEVAIIVGGGPGISASCARLFTQAGLQVAIAARNPDKPILQDLAKQTGSHILRCDASNADEVARLFTTVAAQLGNPRLVVHNIDGRTAEVFRKGIDEVEPEHVLTTLTNSTFSAFLVAQQSARYFKHNELGERGRGTLIFTNASAALRAMPKAVLLPRPAMARRGSPKRRSGAHA